MLYAEKKAIIGNKVTATVSFFPSCLPQGTVETTTVTAFLRQDALH